MDLLLHFAAGHSLDQGNQRRPNTRAAAPCTLRQAAELPEVAYSPLKRLPSIGEHDNSLKKDRKHRRFRCDPCLASMSNANQIIGQQIPSPR